METPKDPIKPKPVLTRPDRNMKVSTEDWETIKALYCNGAKGKELAKTYGISTHRIRQKAREEKWPTPGRIRLAQRNPESLSTNDPARAVADLWMARKETEREDTYAGARKALHRFFAMSPVPQTFAEAAIARKMLKEAIDPDEGKDLNQGNINLAILTQQGFEPKRATGRVVEHDN